MKYIEKEDQDEGFSDNECDLKNTDDINLCDKNI